MIVHNNSSCTFALALAAHSSVSKWESEHYVYYYFVGKSKRIWM